MAPSPEEETPDDGMVYFVYGEQDDDVAFEMCEELEVALGVYQIMIEDGFQPRLYQATEIDVVLEE